MQRASERYRRLELVPLWVDEAPVGIAILGLDRIGTAIGGNRFPLLANRLERMADRAIDPEPVGGFGQQALVKAQRRGAPVL